MLLSVLITSLATARIRAHCLDVNIEYKGGSSLPASQTPGWSSAQSCSSSCSSTPTCRHWSWRGGRCELRTALTTKLTRLGSISGTVRQERCVRGVECHYSGTSELVSCLQGNITK